MNNKVLIIDDEEKLRGLLAKIVGMEGFEVLQAGDCKSGIKKIEQNDIDVVICDVKLPDGRGVDLVKTLKEKSSNVEVILLTAYGNIQDGVQAIKNGAFDYITKGDDNNRIIPLVYKAMDKVLLSKRVSQLEKQLADRHSFDRIIGQSNAILKCVDLAKKVARTDTTVLLTGETGTGKEVFAQAIHQDSLRSKYNFVAINCSAFSKDLLESEMFGYKAGAFTGAVKNQLGLFEEAHNGTIFLDEIGEMSLDLQAKLLRVLETGEFIKVGDTKVTKINVRVIAATHRDLENEIKLGHFREDLFYRISVFQIKLPALRERVTDIEPLTWHFVRAISAKMNKVVKNINPDFIDVLKRHKWNGNIRELKNIIERSLILMENGILDIDNLPLEIRHNSPEILSSFNLADAEKIHIQKVLNHTGGNKTKTAELLNIALTTLYRKIEEYKIF